MSDVPVLVCTTGKLEGQRFTIAQSGLRLGRADQNDVVVIDDGVSRYHAAIKYDEGTMWLSDTGSRNGVFVNEKRLNDAHALKVGDEIGIGAHRFVVQWQSETAKADSGDGKPQERRWRFWPFS